MQVKKNRHIRETEELLINYNSIKQFIKEAEQDIKYLEEEICSFPALEFKEKVQSSISVGSDVEKDALKIIEEKEKLEIRIRQSKRKIAKIDKSLAELKPEQRDVLIYFYIKQYSWTKIADIMNYSERTVRERRRIALRYLSYKMKGASSLVEYGKETLFDRL